MARKAGQIIASGASNRADERGVPPPQVGSAATTPTRSNWFEGPVPQQG